ncbi:MAG: bile acid:sodium symporter [Desulfobacteraceae bacterium]|nr:bile acid:sodium symporter [Desulfobacteraceae bacterium]
MRKIKQQWFLIWLVVVFAGVVIDSTGTIASIGNYLKMHHGSDIVIFVIFIISGMIIDMEELKSGIKDIPSTFIAIVTILIISPVAAGLLSMFPMQKGLIIGLFIVAVMPTTLSSGIVMTGRAGGNMAHALFITIFSNAISILSIPIILSWLLSYFFEGQYIEIDQIAIMTRLFMLVMLPLMIGLILKKTVIKIGNNAKGRMQVFNQILIIGVVFMAASSTANMFGNNFKQLFLIAIIVTIFHIILLLFSFYSAKIFKIGKGRYESIVFMGSQKTLALAVIIQLTYFSEYGIALLVCVVHHFIHLMIDGYLCVKIKNDDR